MGDFQTLSGGSVMGATVWITPAIRDVVAERERQKSVEGWTPEHDDAHPDGDLAQAAACYAAPRFHSNTELKVGPIGWPWSWEWWKPKDRRRDLVRAGALILAEIERLDRKGGAA
jgi:hypothetical protein